MRGKARPILEVPCALDELVGAKQDRAGTMVRGLLSPQAHPGLMCPEKHKVPAPLPLRVSGTLTQQPFSKGIPCPGSSLLLTKFVQHNLPPRKGTCDLQSLSLKLQLQ